MIQDLMIYPVLLQNIYFQHQIDSYEKKTILYIWLNGYYVAANINSYQPAAVSIFHIRKLPRTRTELQLCQNLEVSCHGRRKVMSSLIKLDGTAIYSGTTSNLINYWAYGTPLTQPFIMKSPEQCQCTQCHIGRSTQSVACDRSLENMKLISQSQDKIFLNRMQIFVLN